MAKSNHKTSLDDRISTKRNRVVKANLRKTKEREIEKYSELEFELDYLKKF